MLLYKYTAIDSIGIKKHGLLLANDYNAAYCNITQKKYHPIFIKKIIFFSKKVKLEDLLLFFTHINFQLKCGVHINDAIESFIDFNSDKIIQAYLLKVVEHLKNGESLSQSFEKCSNVFGKVITSLLKAAEESGNLQEVIANILLFLKLEKEWRINIKRALGYPTFLVFIAISVLVLSIFVLAPQIASLVSEFAIKDVSNITLFMINFLPQHLNLAIFAICISLACACVYLWKNILKIPVLGRIFINIHVWQLSKILHISLSAKLNFIQSLTLAIEMISNANMREKFEIMKENILSGYKIAESCSKIALINPSFITAIYIGEEGNSLDKSFQYISENLYKEILSDIVELGRKFSIGLTLFTGFIFIIILYGLFFPIYGYIEMAGT